MQKKHDRNNKIFQPTEPFFLWLVTVFLISSLFSFLHSNAKAPIVSAPVFGFDRFSVVGSINQCMSTKWVHLKFQISAESLVVSLFIICNHTKPIHTQAQLHSDIKEKHDIISINQSKIKRAFNEQIYSILIQWNSNYVKPSGFKNTITVLQLVRWIISFFCIIFQK